MVLEIKYVNANNAVIHTENLVTGILAKISLGTGIWVKFRLGTGIWYPPSRPSFNIAGRVLSKTAVSFCKFLSFDRGECRETTLASFRDGAYFNNIIA